MNQDIIGGYWPLYEDGTPVRIGDTVEGTIVPMEVKGVEVYAAATTVIGDCDHLHLSPGERVRRVGDAPADTLCLCRDPDGGVETRRREDNQNWHLVIDGVRYGVSNHARSRIAEALDLTTGRQTLPSGITWPEVDGDPVVPGDVMWDDRGFRHEVSEVMFKTGFMSGVVKIDAEDMWWTIGALSLTRTEPEPVFDRDGVPIEVGDTVWHEADGTELRVIGFQHEEDGERIVTVERVRGPIDWDGCRCLSLSHQRPDSWERLTEDATKAVFDYWSCRDVDHDGCPAKCPAKVDGKDPRQRYGTDMCFIAMRADIVARAKALAGVMDDE